MSLSNFMEQSYSAEACSLSAVEEICSPFMELENQLSCSQKPKPHE
jgi:hypothetical protein